MKKINYFVLGIVCAVLIVSMFSVASAKWSLFKSSDEPQLAPDSIPRINAHECKADGVCEANDIDAKNANLKGILNIGSSSFNPNSLNYLTYLSGEELNVLAKFGAMPQGGPTSASYDYATIIRPIQISVIAGAGQGQALKSSLLMSDRILFSHTFFPGGPEQKASLSPLSEYGGISASYLAGSGNAYACLDSNGKLFRSDKPCR